LFYDKICLCMFIKDSNERWIFLCHVFSPSTLKEAGVQAPYSYQHWSWQ
jgi:hypothetical protein